VPNTYLDVDTTTGRLKRNTAISTSAGNPDANKVVSTNGSGKIDSSLIDSTVFAGGGDFIQTTEALQPGDWVTIYLSGGVRKCRKALAQDATRPAHGFVDQAWAINESAKVFRGGTNSQVPLSGFSSSDMGAAVFLAAGTAGSSAKTPPSAGGQLIQRVGYVVDVAGTVAVQMELGPEIVL
jgi:hypothetical protein